MQWEKIRHTPHYGNLYRARVPGGWLVLADTWARHEEGSARHYDATGVALCFYPDALHQWTIEEESEAEGKPDAE